jgi:hypothetical protein
MKNKFQILRFAILILVSTFTFTSCVDKEYDDIETANVDPNITPTHTIKELQALATGSAGVEITTDVIIAGVVIGDDRTGNIYKKIILQQDSSGIAIQVDVSNFYTEYPTGRRVFVYCKGLFIANSEGNFELGISGTDPVGRIPAGLVTKYLVKGMWGQYITPKLYTIADAETNPTSIPTNTLVTFDDVEFAPGDYGIAYAASSPANLTLEDCAATPHTLILYSSTYATFAYAKTPIGKGSITGVYIIYSGEGELQIRDTTDVNMPDVRCDGSTGNALLMPLDSVRMLDPGAGNVLYLPGDKKIEVVVTSNYSTNMLGGGGNNIYVQDNTAAIQIRFDDPHTFAIGTKLEINISGMELSTYSGVLQINNVPLGNAIPIGTGTVTPRVATIADLIANYDTWESQVVKVDNVTITGSGIYSGTNLLSDGTGTIDLYTRSQATFASTPYPTGTVSVTGLLIEFNGLKEITIRDLTDVQ